MNRRVLLIDDDVAFLDGIKRQLRSSYDINVESNANRALELLKKSSPFAVILADYMMPEMDGITFLKQARSLAPDSFCLILTGYPNLKIPIEMAIEGQVDRFLCKPLVNDNFKLLLDELIDSYNRKMNMTDIHTIISQLSPPANLTETAFNRIINRIKQLEFTNEINSVYALHMMLHKKIPAVAQHSVRVGNLAWHLGEALELNKKDLQGLYLSALVHDIGKIAIPDIAAIHGDSLDASAISLLQKHCLLGYEVLKNFLFTRPIPLVALQHHEHTNGSGYPSGLAYRKINYDAQIVGICDYVDREILKYSLSSDWKPIFQRLFSLKDKAYSAPLVEAMLALYNTGVINETTLNFDRNILDFDKCNNVNN